MKVYTCAKGHTFPIGDCDSWAMLSVEHSTDYGDGIPEATNYLFCTNCYGEWASAKWSLVETRVPNPQPNPTTGALK